MRRVRTRGAHTHAPNRTIRRRQGQSKRALRDFGWIPCLTLRSNLPQGRRFWHHLENIRQQTSLNSGDLIPSVFFLIPFSYLIL